MLLTDTQTDNMKTVYPPQTKFARGIISRCHIMTRNIVKIKVNNTAFKMLPRYKSIENITYE